MPLFNAEFKEILFKLFILPSYDYCSTLFFHFSNQTDSNILVESFSKNIFKFLKIKLLTIMLKIKDVIMKWI